MNIKKKISSKEKSLGIVLKLTSVCNLRCSYCYVFRGKDHSYQKQPNRISIETISQLVSFLQQGIEDLNLNKVNFTLFGGEPLIIGKKRFSEICQQLNDLSAKVKISVQTNGVLIDDEWIDLFLNEKVGVGISLDGSEKEHDQFRIDAKGRGSYRIIVENIKKMHHKKLYPGILSVIYPKRNAKKIYNHFTKEIGLQKFDVLLPKNTHDDVLPYSPQLYGKFLCDLFDAWIEDDKPEISIRTFSSLFNLIKGGTRYVYGIGPYVENSLPLISISTDGKLSPTSEFVSMGEEIMNTNESIWSISLKNFLNHKIFIDIKQAERNLPNKCRQCCWEKICGGSCLINRYKTSNGWDNPSIYCKGLMLLYSKICAYFIYQGYSRQQIKELLGLKVSC